MLSGSDAPVEPGPEAHALAEALGYPVIVKASMGGGGRGMRVVESADALDAALDQARREAGTAFGVPDVFLEKFVRRAKHIEVQLLGDLHGNLVHLYERDCSVQRRHQKIIEIAPAYNLDPAIRQAICDAAVALGRHVGYENAGTVEFLVDVDTGAFYFIEVNPRIQVEHTVTEIVTGIDLIKSQILIAGGVPLSDPEIDLPDQNAVQAEGFAFQCRVTTEDPENKFTPDYGRITHYRSPGGLGLRLDGGTAITGGIITPFYDSMLVKISASGNRFIDAARRMERALQEFRVRGVKTNVPFLLNVVTHPDFLAGDAPPGSSTRPRRCSGSRSARTGRRKLLTFAAEVTVNGFPGVTRPAGYATRARARPAAIRPAIGPPPGSRQLFQAAGARGVRALGPRAEAALARPTRPSATPTSRCWRPGSGPATCSASPTPTPGSAPGSSRSRCGAARPSIPPCGSSRKTPGTGWPSSARRSPTSSSRCSCGARTRSATRAIPTTSSGRSSRRRPPPGSTCSASSTRSTGSPTWKSPLEAVREAGALCEAAICYTGDILDPKRTKYNLAYYVDLASELEKRGANLIAIKDMAGLCKPFAAERLIKALREEVGVPIHFHTHDIGGAQAASVLRGAEVGLDIADGAVASMSGLTSQPSLNAIVESLRFTPRESGVDPEALIEISRYWEEVRNLYAPFETGRDRPSAEVYAYEMPGGQYTNLFQQAKALGLASRWPEVCKAYAEVNLLFGDIVKVTPTSKVVGDMALFLVANNLTPADTLDPERELAFPESVVELFEGRLGQPPGGFPAGAPGAGAQGAQAARPSARARTCRRPTSPRRARRPAAARPARRRPRRAELPALSPRLPRPGRPRAVLLRHVDPADGDLLLRPRPGRREPRRDRAGQDADRQAPGRRRAARRRQADRLLRAQRPAPRGRGRRPLARLGRPRDAQGRPQRPQPDRRPAARPGRRRRGRRGDAVRKGQKLLSIEAMKMETTLYAERPGRVAEVLTASATRSRRASFAEIER